MLTVANRSTPRIDDDEDEDEDDEYESDELDHNARDDEEQDDTTRTGRRGIDEDEDDDERRAEYEDDSDVEPTTTSSTTERRRSRATAAERDTAEARKRLDACVDTHLPGRRLSRLRCVRAAGCLNRCVAATCIRTISEGACLRDHATTLQHCAVWRSDLMLGCWPRTCADETRRRRTPGS